MDNGSNYRDIVPDTYNTSNLWGPSEYDAPAHGDHQLHLRIPFLKNNQWVGGWSLAGTAQFQTGAPCGIGTNNDYAGVGEVWQLRLRRGRPVLESERHAHHQYGRVRRASGDASSVQVFHGERDRNRPPALSISKRACATRFTSLASRIGTSRLFKTFEVNERCGFQFRAEAYDFPNHPNLSGPNLTANVRQFGRDHQQDRASAKPPALAALLLLAKPVALCEGASPA